jgi:ABC-2 type transport system permease protein
MTALAALVRKDIALYFSNRRALLITLAAPILIAAFFGSVLGGAPKQAMRIPIAVVETGADTRFADIAARIKADDTCDVKVLPEADAIRLVREGKVRAAVAFKPDGVAIHHDPSQSMTLPMIRGVLTQHAFGVLHNKPKIELPFPVRDVEVAGRTDRNYNGYAHAFAGMGVQFVLFMGIEMGVGLLLMRRMGLWKRLRAAPVTRSLLLGSRIASGAVIASALLAGIYAAAILVFGVRIDGSVVGFVLITLSFAILTASFGLLIAALGKTPEATRGLAILATLLLVMLGGAWVPTFVFPEWLQRVTAFVPTRWAIDGLEAMTWRGLGLEAAWMPVGAMLACSAVFAALAIRRFAWEE